MSRITLAPNASGTGTLTVAAPNTNTDRTLTLPDATGTVNISGLANEVPAGSAGSPSIYSTGDSNTGVFFPAADTVAVSTAGVERMRVDSSGTISAGSGTTNINYNIGGQIQMPAATTETRSIDIGVGRTGNGYAHIDFIGDATYTDFGLRIIRNNTGSNASSEISHRGTGGLILTAFDNSFIYLQTNNTVRFVVGSAGQLGIGGATYGTSGQVLTSGGSGAAPSWSAAPAPTTAQVGAATAALAVGDVGSYAWLTYQVASGAVAVGTTFAGANLRYHGVVVVNADAAGACGVWGGAPSGTWRCMGSNGANGGRFPTNIYLRIS